MDRTTSPLEVFLRSGHGVPAIDNGLVCPTCGIGINRISSTEMLDTVKTGKKVCIKMICTDDHDWCVEFTEQDGQCNINIK